MTDTDSSNITNGNGNGQTITRRGAAPKPSSALTLLLKEIETSKKKVNETDKKSITNAFVKAMGERSKLQAALDAFDEKADETAVAMVRCYGSAHVTVAGVRYVPTSRGTRVYYKKMSDTQGVIELG